MFYATFNVNAQALSMFPDQMSIGTVNGVSFKIKTADKPNVELTQKELNQYNRKRYAYTKTEYRPVSLSLYDTVDNKPFNLWIEYFTYYFGDARLKTSMTMGSNPTDPTFDDSTGWGLRPLAEQVNFFTSLDIYSLFGKQYTLIQYLNPKIASIDWGNYDTSDSGLTDLKMSLSYETLQYDSGTITPQLATQFGFDVGLPTLEPTGVQTPIIQSTRPEIANSPRRILDTTTDIISPSSSVISNFGMSGTSYNTLISGVRNTPIQTTMQPTANFQYANGVGNTNMVRPQGGLATGLSDINTNTVRPQGGLANAPSDLPPGENYGIVGVPNGQLPNSNQWLPLDPADTFKPVSNSGVYNLLGSFGDFNFGYIPSTGLPSNGSIRTNDIPLSTALPVIAPGQRGPHVDIEKPTPLNTVNGNYGRGFRTQPQQVAVAAVAAAQLKAAQAEYAAATKNLPPLGQAGGYYQDYLKIGLQIAAKYPYVNFAGPAGGGVTPDMVSADTLGMVVIPTNPVYDNTGINSGYNYGSYQPAPEPQFGPNLAERAALSNNTVGTFGYLTDPFIYGGNPSDNNPPPVVIPNRN
jgi:hypothetical protein